jgi:hypothetical protein
VIWLSVVAHMTASELEAAGQPMFLSMLYANAVLTT